MGVTWTPHGLHGNVSVCRQRNKENKRLAHEHHGDKMHVISCVLKRGAGMVTVASSKGRIVDGVEENVGNLDFQ